MAARSQTSVLGWLGLCACLAACDPSAFEGPGTGDTQSTVETEELDAGLGPSDGGTARAGAQGGRGSLPGNGGRGGSGEGISGGQAEGGTAARGQGSKGTGSGGTGATQAPTETAGMGGASPGNDPSAGTAPMTGVPADPCAGTGTRPLAISESGFVELARMRRPSSVSLRVLGPSFGFAGDDITWLFASTILTAGFNAPPQAPFNLPHAVRTGTDKPWAPEWMGAPDASWSVEETLNADGVPQPLLLLPDNETNAATTYTPLSVLPDAAGGTNALVFLGRGTTDQDPTEVYVADLAPGASQLTNLRSEALFSAADPLFAPSLQHDGYTYAVAWDVASSSYKLARAATTRLTERSAYDLLARDGADAWSWQPEAAASPVIEGAQGRPSLTWNQYLGAFLMVHGELFSANIVLESATDPTGPWTRQVIARTSPSAWGSLGVRQQNAWSASCDQRVYITYLESGPSGPNMYPETGEVVLGYVELQ